MAFELTGLKLLGRVIALGFFDINLFIGFKVCKEFVELGLYNIGACAETGLSLDNALDSIVAPLSRVPF